MYIVPNTIIRILKGVNLDNTYKHTIYFDSASVQANYFTAKNKYELNNYSYQRQTKTLKVGIKSDDLFDCNYLMFRNTSFGTKWFYAFITNVEYINNDTSEITFEIDVMQTWFFDYQIRRSFVEREHSSTDAIGDNIVEENLETGDFVNIGFLYSRVTDMELMVVVATSFDAQGQWARGQFYNGVYSGLRFYGFTDEEYINDFLEEINDGGKSDGIVSIFMMPKEFFGDGSEPKDITITKHYNEPLRDGYIPKNNKLYTYPYNFLSVINGDGENAIYKYEHFGSDECKFSYYGDMTANPSVLLYPWSYKGSGAQNYEEGIIMSGFPQCAYTTDIFKAWLAQNASSLGISALSSVTQAVGGASVGSVPLVLNGLAGITSLLTQGIQKSVLPPQARGTGSSSSLNISLGRKNFMFHKMSLRIEYLEIIDEYFSMFGYATKRVKVPNLKTRKEWNFVKTIDVNLTGSIPADALAKLKTIYNDGVTFWHKGNNVGMYNLDNGVI